MSVLFKSYCMNVYGSQLWSYNDFRAVERCYTAWRKLYEGFSVLIKQHIIYLFMLLITVYQLVYYYKKDVLNLFGIYIIVPI